MENEFDYMNDTENAVEQSPVIQSAEETIPEQQDSPYGSSPYAYTYTPSQEEKPAPQPKQKKSGKGVVIAVSIVAGVMLLLNIILLITATSLRGSLETQQDQNQALSSRLDDLENQLDQIDQNSQNIQSSQGSQSGTATVPTTPGQEESSAGSLTPRQVYAMNVQAVVAVTSEGVTTNFYGQTSKTASTGSGFIISADGYVVTNYHVIEGGSQFSVITYDEQEHEATVIGYDKTNDVALLKLEGEDFQYVTIGNSDELQVGDQVMAIGNPLGELTSTLTVGYVSAKDRMVSTDGTAINMLQTDAAINSGNSGGPLFNAKGEVIGINTAKYSGTSSSGATIEGIGFAIPMADVVGIIEDLRDKGYVSSTYLGVMVREVDSAAQSYGLPAGVYVEEVTSGYCAEKAGVKAKDIIIAVGEYEVDSMSALTRVLRRFEAGDQTTITVYRSGQELTLDITLDEKPVQETATEPTEQETTSNNGGSYTYPDIWDFFFGG